MMKYGGSRAAKFPILDHLAGCVKRGEFGSAAGFGYYRSDQAENAEQEQEADGLDEHRPDSFAEINSIRQKPMQSGRKDGKRPLEITPISITW